MTVGQPAPDWTLKDLDGKEHSLRDYRGKVVVLDFWYRACGLCIRAMREINQLVQDFKGSPVIVLGMNTDSNPKDAQFIAEKMKLNYANLRAATMPERYGVTGFPFLIVIDQQGVIRYTHTGFSSELRKSVAQAIGGLLAKPGQR